MKKISAIPASAGIAIGPVFVYQPAKIELPRCQVEDTGAEWERLKSALAKAIAMLDKDIKRAQEKLSGNEAAIFEAHREMLDDPELLDAAYQRIHSECLNAEAAFDEAAEGYAKMLENMEDEYFRARAADIRDVKKRVVHNLLGIEPGAAFAGLKKPSIIAAHDLTPSDTIALDKSLVLGFVTAYGGPTSHTAILARGLGLPAVVGAGADILTLTPGTELILDGQLGEVICEADAGLTGKYRKQQEQQSLSMQEALKKAHQPAITSDGHKVEVAANIGSVQDAKNAVALGAEGVGLLRTEFVYLHQERLPSEEEQYQVYKQILDEFGEFPIILRTLDIGGDKEVPYLNIAQEMNSFLGVRAVRLCLGRPDLFKPQLRAALRAAQGHAMRIMFPMIATVQEVVKARRVMDECRKELLAEGHDLPDTVSTGIMVEIPSAVLLADHLSKVVDFFSIGTNDLTQYTMAADRTNPTVGYLSSAFSPAVLRLIADLIVVAHKNGKWVGMCGELAGEPLAVPILLGLGLDEFSMNAPAIPGIKEIIRTLSYEECKRIAQEALKLGEAEEVQDYIRKAFPGIK